MPNVFMADDLTGWVYLYDNTTNREKEATMCILIPQVYSCKGDHTYCISDIKTNADSDQNCTKMQINLYSPGNDSNFETWMNKTTKVL